MGMVQKAFIILLCMNLFLYVYLPSEYQTGQDNILTLFVNLDGDRPSLEGTELAENMPSSLSTDSAVVGTGSLSIVSTFRMVWNFVSMILNYIFAPILILNMVPSMPGLVQLLFLLPIVLVLSFGTISFIKGYNW